MGPLKTLFSKWCYKSPASGFFGGKAAFYNPRVDSIYLPVQNTTETKNIYPFYLFEQVHRLLASTRFRCYMRLIAALAYHCIQEIMDEKTKKKEELVAMLDDLNEILEELHKASFLVEEVFSLFFTVNNLKVMGIRSEGEIKEIEKNALLLDYGETESFEDLYHFYKEFQDTVPFESWYLWLVTDALNSKTILFYIPVGLNPAAISAAKRQIKEILKTISPDVNFRRNLHILGNSSVFQLGSFFPIKKNGSKFFLRRHKGNPLNFWCRKDRSSCLWKNLKVRQLMVYFKSAPLWWMGDFSDNLCKLQTKGLSTLLYHPEIPLDHIKMDKAELYLSTASHIFTEEGKIYYNTKTKSRSVTLLFWEMINMQIYQREGLECPLAEIRKCTPETFCHWKESFRKFYEVTKNIYKWEKPSCL